MEQEDLSYFQKSKKARDNIRNKFNRAEYRRQFRTRIIVGTAIMFAVIWAGFIFIPSLHSIFDISVFVDALVVIAIISQVVNAYAQQADFDEYNENKDIQKEVEMFNETVSNIEDYVIFSKQTRAYNEKRKELQSENERLDHIEELKTDLAIAFDKGKRKREKKLERKIAYWQLKNDSGNYVHTYKPKNFEPYLWESFTSVKKSNTKKHIPIDYKSSKVISKKLNRINAIRIIILITFRATISSYIASSFLDFSIFMAIVLGGSLTGAIVAYEMTRDDIKINEIGSIKSKHQELKAILNTKIET